MGGENRTNLGARPVKDQCRKKKDSKTRRNKGGGNIPRLLTYSKTKRKRGGAMSPGNMCSPRRKTVEDVGGGGGKFFQPSRAGGGKK